MTLEQPTATSEQTAEEGCVLVRGPHRDYILSDAVAWREGATYILRSSEFDIMAEDGDFGEAVDLFLRRLLDYTTMLYELVQKDEATPEEASTFTELAGRFFPLVQALQGDRARTRRRWPPRRRGSGSGHWRHRGTRASDSAQLSAT